MINKQNKSKALLAIIGILLIANIGLVLFLLLKKEERHEKPDRKVVIGNFLKQEIGFDTAQLSQYNQLSDTHRENMKAFMDSLRNSKEKQFKELAAADFTDSAMNIIAEQSAANQKLMELRMFGHLKKIRMLCTAQQRPAFDSLFGKLLNKRGGDVKKTNR